MASRSRKSLEDEFSWAREEREAERRKRSVRRGMKKNREPVNELRRLREEKRRREEEEEEYLDDEDLELEDDYDHDYRYEEGDRFPDRLERDFFDYSDL
jgi:hypothetical protein